MNRVRFTTLVAAALLFLIVQSLIVACGTRNNPQQSNPPPTITFSQPAANSCVHGQVNVTATATGAVAVKSFSFIAPSGLTNTPASYDPSTRTAQLSGTIDCSAMADGPLKITASATDDVGLTSTQDLNVQIAQAAPAIIVNSPSDGATVKGVAVAVTASAVAQNGATISKLEIISPPRGMTANTSPAANLFTASWDTTQALEGVTSLHFRATDSTGLVADKTISVTVDNVPFGTFDVRVSAGAPIPGATVTIYAINDSTGSVNAAVATNGVLGSAGPTDSAGKVHVVLSTENYIGPVQIVASGTSLQYVDPSWPLPSSNIQLPTNFTLTSYLASYATGSGVTTPVTLWTTLADHEALAYAHGLHPAHQTTTTLSAALAARDQLFVQHIVNSSSAWAPTALRTTVPVMLTQGAQTLVDVAYAELFDTALNALAHDIVQQAGYSRSSTVINAITLMQLLEQDLDADGMFDGKGSGGAALLTTGSTPVTLDAQTLRVPLATALDEFIYDTSVNKSGITRTDLTNANVYNTISQDASDLFGAPPSGSFDNTPPNVTYSITYSIAGGPQNTAPVGAQAFVGGQLTIIADASDPSGVQSLSVKQGSNIVAPQQGSTASHFIGTWDTTKSSDGSLSFTITAVDNRNNSGNTTIGVVVDNTNPTITPTSPSPSTYYSSSVLFDVSAGDAGSGVATLTQSGFNGLTDTDSAVAHFYGVWTVPTPGPADGTFSGGSFQSCDVVGNCRTLPVPVLIDRTAPTVTLTSPPQYTNANSVTLAGTVNDAGSGVSLVWVQVGSLTPQSVTPSNGQWIYSITNLANGPTSLSVWAEDNAQGALGAAHNSGHGLSATYNPTAQILRDTTPPTATLSGSLASYYDETGMTIGVGSNGLATVPPTYSYKSPTRVSLNSGASIYKASTRVSWTSTPTATELETTNTNNVPVLQFAVPFNASSDAPITTANYSVALTCAGCTAGPATGALWPSPTIGAGLVYYDLPLTGNLIPGLATVTGPATLAVTLTLADSAGNSSTSTPFTFTWHTIGAPLAWIEDTTYGTAADPRNTTYYKIGNNTYGTLFDPYATAFSPQNLVRLARFIVTNPASRPVGLNLAASAIWTANETWPGDGQALALSSYSADGYSFNSATTWCNGTCDAVPTNPCGDWNSNVTYHTAGNMGAQYSCSAVGSGHGATLSTWSGAQSSSPNVTSHAYTPSSGFDPSVAPMLGSTYVVPAASGTTPGQLVVYVERPVLSNYGRSRPLTYTKLNPSASTGNRFELWVEDAWHATATATCTQTIPVLHTPQTNLADCTTCGGYWYTSACICQSGNCNCGSLLMYKGQCPTSSVATANCYTSTTASVPDATFQASRYLNYLSTGVDSLSGSLSASTIGITPDGSAVAGETSTLLSGLSLSRSISH